MFDLWRDLGAVPDRVLAVGGGTQNAVWLQSTSDFGGVAQVVPRVTVGASYGDAFLAALAVGAVAATDIAHWNPPARTVPPAGTDLHTRRNALFRTLYLQTRDISHALA